jgi:hypothetical protein
MEFERLYTRSTDSVLWLAPPRGAKSFIYSCNPSTAGQARDSCAEIKFKNHINYNDLLITSVSASLDAVPNFLCTTSDRVRLPELRQRTPTHHARNQPPAKNFALFFRALYAPVCMSADRPTYRLTVSAVAACSLTNTAILVLLKAAFLYSHAAINSG